MGREMKVALELQPCCGKRSGIGTYVYELAKRLKNQDGLEFCGNLFNFAGRNDNSESLKGIDMPIRESRVFPYGVYRRVWNLVPIPYQGLFPGEADLSVFFNYVVPPRVSGRVITTIHDMTWLRFPETMDQRNYRRLKNGMAYSIGHSDRILTVSSFSREEIHKLLHIPREKISVVYNAASCSPEAEPFEAVAEKYPIRRPYILYVGTIEPRKNLVRLIQAFTWLRKEYGIPHQLVLAGGRGWNCGDVYQAAREGAPENEIVFTGYISQGEKNALYQNAGLFVFPSLYEGFGIPPLEAMEMGCPVVCSNAASLPEVAGEAARLVDPLDVAEIARGIWDVLSDSGYASRLVERGYQQAKKFTWAASAEKLAEICAAVLEGS